MTDNPFAAPGLVLMLLIAGWLTNNWIGPDSRFRYAVRVVLLLTVFFLLPWLIGVFSRRLS